MRIALSVIVVTAIALPARARDITLEEAVAAARTRSPSVGLEDARLAEAEADHDAALSAFWPRLSATASYNRFDEQRLSPVAGASQPSLYGEELYAGVRAKWVLFDGLRSWTSRSASARGVEAARAGVRVSEADAELDATVAFTRLLAAQHLTGVSSAALERQRRFTELTRARAEAGRSAALDAMKARAQELEAVRSLVSAQENEAVAAELLRRAIGLEDQEPLRAVGELAAVAVEAAPVEPLDVAGNADLVRAEAQLEQASSAASAARGGYFPEISLQGLYGYRERDLGTGEDEWSGGVFLEWSLFEGGLTRAQVRKAEARVLAAREGERALRLALTAEAREALASWRAALASLTAADENVAVSREAHAAAMALYEIGRATSLDVLTAQADLARSEAALVQARADYVVARARSQRLAVR